MFATIRGSFPPALRSAVAAFVVGTVTAVAVLGSTVPAVASTPTATQVGGAQVGAQIGTAAPAAASRAKRTKRGIRVLRVAAQQSGDPYRYGAEGPNAFDCSGLTSFAYRVGAHRQIPRTSSAQRAATRRIRASAARPGDLVFFHGSSGVYHVGIFAGKGRIWHAPYSGTRVHKARIWTSAVSYGRVR